MKAMALQREEQACLDLLDKRLCNFSNPIGRLPNELLAQIFRVVQRTRGPLWPTPDFNPRVLAAVCHRWMSFILSTSGAFLWTDIDVIYEPADPPLSAVNALRSALIQSRPLPVAVSIGCNKPSSFPDPEAVEIKSMIYLVASDVSRYQKLSIFDVHTYKHLFPLTGHFENLTTLSLDFGELGFPNHSLFHHASFPVLRDLHISDLYLTDAENGHVHFDYEPLTSHCTQLLLMNITSEPDELVEFLRHFPILTSLRIKWDNWWDEQDPLEMAFDPGHMVTFPVLQLLELNGGDSISLMHLIIAPVLEIVSLHGPNSAIDHSIPIGNYPRLQSLEVCEVNMSVLQLAELIASPGSVSSIFFRTSPVNLAEALLQMCTSARQISSSSANEGRWNAQNRENATSVVLHLDFYNGWNDDGEDSKIQTSVIVQLDALSTIDRLRKSAYGSGFRVHLSESFMEHPQAARMLAQFPGFLKVAPVGKMGSRSHFF